MKHKKKTVTLIILAVSIFLSIFLLRPVLKSEKTTSYSTGYLNQKEKTVLAITASATTASVVLAAVPGDATTPIADKLADVSGYMAIVLSAVILEKHLIPITSEAASLFIIPGGLILLILYMLFRKKALKSMGIRLLLFSVVLVCLIPLSITISRTVDNVYQTSISEVINEGENSAEIINSEENTDDENQSWLDKISGTVQNSLNAITEGADEIASQFKNLLNDFIKLVAVMIVTSILIPVLTLLVMWWLVKLIFSSAMDSDRDIQKISRQLDKITERN